MFYVRLKVLIEIICEMRIKEHIKFMFLLRIIKEHRGGNSHNCGFENDLEQTLLDYSLDKGNNLYNSKV